LINWILGQWEDLEVQAELEDMESILMRVVTELLNPKLEVVEANLKMEVGEVLIRMWVGVEAILR
jgi:hypothetical protein